MNHELEFRLSESFSARDFYDAALERLRLPESKRQGDAHHDVGDIDFPQPNGQTKSALYELNDYHKGWAKSFDDDEDLWDEQDRLLTEGKSIISIRFFTSEEQLPNTGYLVFKPNEVEPEIAEAFAFFNIPETWPKDKPVIVKKTPETNGDYFLLEDPSQDDLLRQMYKQWQNANGL